MLFRSSETIETSVDVVGGMLVERGWLVSPAGNSNSFVLEGDDSSPVFVLVYDHDIKTMNDLMSDATGDTNRGILPQIAIKYWELGSLTLLLLALRAVLVCLGHYRQRWRSICIPESQVAFYCKWHRLPIGRKMIFINLLAA